MGVPLSSLCAFTIRYPVYAIHFFFYLLYYQTTSCTHTRIPRVFNMAEAWPTDASDRSLTQHKDPTGADELADTMGDSPLTVIVPCAATKVLGSAALFRHITNFMDGVPLGIKALVDAAAVHTKGTGEAAHWSTRGEIVTRAVDRGDIVLLRWLLRLSLMRTYRDHPAISFEGVARKAIERGKLEVLQWLHSIGLLVPDAPVAGNDHRRLMALAVRHGGALTNSLTKLEIISWIYQVAPHASLGVTPDDLVSSAMYPNCAVVKFLHDHGYAAAPFGDTEQVREAGDDDQAHAELIRAMRGWRPFDARIMDCAASADRLDTVIFLHENRTEGCTRRAMDGAATNGHFDVVEFLHNNRDEGCTTQAMNGAARHGHLDAVEFLHANRTEGCTTDAMDLAAANGHLDVVRFLHEHRREGCTTNAMDNAASSGHLDVVQFLHANRSEGCTTGAMDGAARNGFLDVVRFLHENRSEGCTTDAMDGAALCGCLDTITFLHEHRTEGCTANAMDGAAWMGHLDVIKFLDNKRVEGCTARAMDAASANGRLDIVRFLDRYRDEGCTTSAMDAAAARGDIYMVQFLHEHRWEGCTAQAMHEAAVRGHIDVVHFLGQHRREGALEHTLERVAASGDMQCVKAICHYTTQGCLFDARKSAVANGHADTAAFLLTLMDPEVRICSGYRHVTARGSTSTSGYGPRRCQRRGPPRDVAPDATTASRHETSSSRRGILSWLAPWL